MNYNMDLLNFISTMFASIIIGASITYIVIALRERKKNKETPEEPEEKVEEPTVQTCLEYRLPDDSIDVIYLSPELNVFYYDFRIKVSKEVKGPSEFSIPFKSFIRAYKVHIEDKTPVAWREND